MSEIETLRLQEKELVGQRAKCKKELQVLTRKIYNLRQKINYHEATRNKKQSSGVFGLFGKQKKDLTPEELREYNRIMYQKRQNKHWKILKISFDSVLIKL